jgi:hypothetical protein
MKDFLDGIIKLLQYVSVSATVIELILRVVRYWFTR